MEVRRLRRGEWLALASALVLLGSLFATWYDRPAGARIGWEAFSVVDIVLSLAALCGIALAFLTATRRSPSLPVAFAVITIVLSALCVLVVAYRLAQPPGDDADPAVGALAGQAAVLALLAGAWLSLRDETRGTEHMPGVPVQDRPAPPPVT